MLYKEQDIGFGVGVGLTAQEDWIVIGTGDNVTSEVRLVPASDRPAPESSPVLALVDQMPDAFVVADSNLEIVTANAAFVEKAKPEAVEKARADHAMHAAEAERLAAALARLG